MPVVGWCEGWLEVVPSVRLRVAAPVVAVISGTVNE
jgi:hypothetical protein